MRNRDSIPLLICGAINFTVYFLFQATIGKKFLEDFAEIPGSRASSFTCAMMICCMVTIFFSGFVSRLIGNRRKPVLIASCALTLISLCVLLSGMALGAPSWVYLVLYMGFAASASGSAMFASCLIKEVNPANLIGVSIGMVNCLAYLTIAASINLAGMVLDLFKSGAIMAERRIIYPPQAYVTLFCILLAFAAISFAASCFARETRGVCRA